MKKWAYILLIFAIFTLEPSYALNDPVEQMVKRVKQMDIISYRLEWAVNRNGDWEYFSIYEGNDKRICDGIKNAMDDIIIEDSFTSVSIGTLVLVDKDSVEEKIDICDLGFIAEGGRKSFRGFFISSNLAEIVKSMVEQSAYKDRIAMPENLFERLSTVYEIPKAKEPFK